MLSHRRFHSIDLLSLDLSGGRARAKARESERERERERARERDGVCCVMVGPRPGSPTDSELRRCAGLWPSVADHGHCHSPVTAVRVKVSAPPELPGELESETWHPNGPPARSGPAGVEVSPVVVT